MVLNYRQIGQRIRIIRKTRKMTQAELAERASLSVPYISHIENGIKQASLQAVVNIADALDCTADKLLYECQPSGRGFWQTEWAELLSDCTEAEKRFLLAVLSAAKDCIRVHSQHFGSINR